MNIPIQNLPREYKSIKKEVDKAISEILTSAQYTSGDVIKQFEQDFADFCNTKYCIGTGSGTDSLLIALKAIDIHPGDEVITTPLTFIATAEAIVLAGGKPVFVDVDPKTWNLDPKKIEAAITKKTKAIIPVHLYGTCCEMDLINKIAQKHNIFVIEDASHAHGSLYMGKPAGSLGDIGCFSFYPTKTLGAYGNAGAITTNNPALHKKMKMMSDHGREGDRYIHHAIGYTGTIDTIQATILNIKLKHVKEWILRRQEITNHYKNHLEVQIQDVPHYCKPSFYAFTCVVKDRNTVQKTLKKNGVETQIYYPIPLHLQPSLHFLAYKRGDFPITENLCNTILSLPIYPTLQYKEITFVIQVFSKTYLS